MTRQRPKDRPLNEYELQVLTLIADGRTRHEVASILYISLHTVAKRLSCIRSLLGARNTVHSVTLAFRAGLLPVKDDDR